MKNTLVIALGLMMLLSSCGQNERASERELAPAKPSRLTASAAPPSAESDEAPVQANAEPLLVPTSVVAPARLLVYHADLRLKVASIPRASTRLDSLVRRSGGYLSAATEARVDGEWRQEMTIRVVPSRFPALMAALSNLGSVEEKKLTTDDVTAQHADVAARLVTKRAVEKRYIDLLSRAHKISEILEIEGKLGEVREEIESTESRLKALNDEVAYSTISLICYQTIAQSLPEAPVVSFFSRLVESFYTGWTLLTGLVIGLVTLWPFLLLAPAVWWAVRRWRRRVA
jgi:hypothetical protein